MAPPEKGSDDPMVVKRLIKAFILKNGVTLVKRYVIPAVKRKMKSRT